MVRQRPTAIYLDGADLKAMERYATDPRIAGVTTNPSLMRKAGITRYREFAREVLAIFPAKPVSFEILNDDVSMVPEIASWGQNVYVKVPIVNEAGQYHDFKALGEVKMNITAIMTRDQVRHAASRVPMKGILSIFAGRVADTGQNPYNLVRHAVKRNHGQYVLWASPRQVFDYYWADRAGADIITMTPELIVKLTALKGKDLHQHSADTVRQFNEDAKGIEL